jgi:LmbE family N-acetylglucosaminyl deacetylase
VKNDRVLILAAHTDDGELGCGGTISRFIEEGKQVFYAAFSTAEESVPPEFPPNILETEVRAATQVMGIPPENLLIYKYTVRKLSYSRQEILEELVRLKGEIDPGVVFLPGGQDLHQDHQTISMEGLRAFKHVTVLGYELPWNNLAFQYRHFVILTESHIQKKVDALRCYRSQNGKPYTQEDFIWSWARTRGVQVFARYAEAFDVMRWVLF